MGCINLISGELVKLTGTPQKLILCVSFGTGSFSFFEQAAKFIDYKAFSYCLPTEETKQGYMKLGNYRRQVVDFYTPLFPSTTGHLTYSLMMTKLSANGESLLSAPYSELIVDTGAFWTVLSPDTFSRLDDVITKAMKPLNFTRYTYRGVNHICFVAANDDYVIRENRPVFSDWSILPTMQIGFVGPLAGLRLQSKSLFHNHLKFGLCMNFMKGGRGIPPILGNQLTRSFEVIFDIQGKRFGFRYAAR